MNFAGTAVSLTFESGSDSYLVVVPKDFFVKVYTASDVHSSLAVTRDTKENMLSYFGWNFVSDNQKSDDFVSRLCLVKEVCDRMRGCGTGIIAVGGAPPTTNFTHSMTDNATVGAGNMITLGDTIAVVDEAVVAANYSAVEDTKAKSAPAAPAVNYGKVDHTKVKNVNDEKHTPSAALGAYDMSNMKYSFGRNGEHTGSPSSFSVKTSGMIPHANKELGDKDQH